MAEKHDVVQEPPVPQEGVVVRYGVHVVWDAFGNTNYTVVEDPSNITQLCGLRAANGDPVYFESDAYHIPSWCREHGLGHRFEERSLFFSFQEV